MTFNSGQTAKLSNQQDVAINNVVNEDTLYFNATSEKWENRPVPTPTLADDSVSTAKLQDNAVTNDKIAGLDASKVTSGTFTIDRIASGTPDGTKYVRDDGTLQVLPVTTIPVVLSRPGSLLVSAGSAALPLPYDAVIRSVRTSLGAASGDVANQAVVVDVNVDGESIFANANDRPSIVAGQRASAKVAVSVPVADGQFIMVDVDQAGGLEPATTLGYISSAGGGANANSQIITRPGDAAVGDVYVVMAFPTVGGTVGSTTEPVTTMTAPTGWTKIGATTRNVHNPSARDQDLHMYWWRDDGSQSSWTFTLTQPTTNGYFVVKLIRVRGVVSSGDPIDAYDIDTPAASGTAWQQSAITTTTNGNLLVGIWASPNTVTSPAVTGMNIDNSGNAAFIMGTETQTTAGTTGSRTLTGSTSPTSRLVTALLALKIDQNNAAPGKNLTVVVEVEPQQ